MPILRRLGGLLIRFGRFGEDKVIFTLPVFELWTVQPVAICWATKYYRYLTHFMSTFLERTCYSVIGFAFHWKCAIFFKNTADCFVS